MSIVNANSLLTQGGKKHKLRSLKRKNVIKSRKSRKSRKSKLVKKSRKTMKTRHTKKMKGG